MKRLALAVIVTLLPVGRSAAQPQSCEDGVRQLRVLAESLTMSRARTEIDAARAIADLQKRIEALQAEVEAMRAAAHGEKQ